MEDITASLSPREHFPQLPSQIVNMHGSFLVIYFDCFPQDKNEGKTQLLTQDTLVMVKTAFSFLLQAYQHIRHTFFYLLLPNQTLFSFTHPVALLILVFGSGSPEEDEQISSFVLTEGGKRNAASFSPVGQSLLCIPVHGAPCAAVCVSGCWQ